MKYYLKSTLYCDGKKYTVETELVGKDHATYILEEMNKLWDKPIVEPMSIEEAKREKGL